MDRYVDARFHLMAIRLQPGEFAVASTDEIIVTTLGSCVSACLWDEDAAIGGMNHFMLPHSQSPEGVTAIPYLSYAGRYGINAMEMMINGLLQHGAQRSRLRAKVFGGASVIESMNSSIGDENGRFALAYLAGERIPIAASDIGGVRPRNIYFWPATGEVRVRYLSHEKAALNAIQSENAYAQHLTRPHYGSVDLFEEP